METGLGDAAGFRVGSEHFEVDGRPVRVLAGALHYFRVHEEQWAHRLGMLRAMGLNTVETYVPWNLHEPEPGRFHDVAALGRFLDAAHAAGLWAIVRPGPYICGEWENGGLPHWLTGPLGARVRTRDAEFLAAVERWYRELLPQVAAREFGRGGPVILVQVENEYGSYGTDRVYLERLTELTRACGITAELCTSDGPEEYMLTGGLIPGVLATVNFGSGARTAFETLRRYRPHGPLMCMEFWCGWFEYWGGKPAVRDAADAAGALREILAAGASVSLYMAHGGTNFAGWAGANRAGEMKDGALEADVTSYDYDAPIDEMGRPTEKFWAFREVLAGFQEGSGPLPEVPAEWPVLGAPVTAELSGWAPLDAVVEAVGGPETESALPPTFEELGVDRGLVRYQVGIPGERPPYPLTLAGLRDLAVVYVNGVRAQAGALGDGAPELVEPVAGPASVEIWVESLGRVNYGPLTGEPKGITGGILHHRQYLHGVRARGVRLDAFDDAAAVARIPFRPAGEGLAAQERPEEGGKGRRGLYRASFTVAGAGDARLTLPSWTRGFVWVNGFCLGRYWSVGPQESLYVPGPVLREGANEVWVLELDGAGAPAVRLA
ncbi:beta-galactosidase family protein [Streptomyces sp. NPDC093085]|uniref:glycoside hydrolase family 35 protein n=1 Tax=Streptomyces sp. NPDC093085 TaxID=3155068 RepID=UPI003448E4E6